MIALSPVSLSSVAVIGTHCDDIAIGAGATLMEIVRDKPGVVVHALVLSGGGTEREVDDEVFLGLMRVRGVQCRARYAEAFTLEKAVLDTDDSYSVN